MPKEVIRLTEQDLRNIVSEVIDELHQGQQLMLPFDGDSEPYNWMQYVEWLEEHGKYGTLPSQPDAMEKVMTKKMLMEVGESTFFYGTGEEFDGDYFYEIFEGFVKENQDVQLFNNPQETVDGIMGQIDSPNDVLYHLTPEGTNRWMAFIIQRGKETMDYWLGNRLEINGDGLIYCERMIAMEEANGRYHSEEGNMDYYQMLNDQYNGIGQYWSYAHGGGNVYFYNAHHGQDILVKGWVSPYDVDWVATISLNSMDEQELRLNYDAMVQIDEITTWSEEAGGNIRLPLKGSMVINV